MTEIRQATNVDFARGGSGTFNDFLRTDRDDQRRWRRGTCGTPPSPRVRSAARPACPAAAATAARRLICPGGMRRLGATGCTVRSGGFEADPEAAYAQTYGLIVKPRFVAGLVFSVDRYKIKIDDSLGYNDFSYSHRWLSAFERRRVLLSGHRPQSRHRHALFERGEQPERPASSARARPTSTSRSPAAMTSRRSTRSISPASARSTGTSTAR
ncbi:hypothetical protein QP185_16680 [Sphingomonas aerolata]|uniref:hypothetical protein n=1 Tax=Sphingomonas aerolata TaxID=185951 RepID=UPI002FE4073D